MLEYVLSEEILKDINEFLKESELEMNIKFDATTDKYVGKDGKVYAQFLAGYPIANKEVQDEKSIIEFVISKPGELISIYNGSSDRTDRIHVTVSRGKENKELEMEENGVRLYDLLNIDKIFTDEEIVEFIKENPLIINALKYYDKLYSNLFLNVQGLEKALNKKTR